MVPALVLDRLRDPPCLDVAGRAASSKSLLDLVRTAQNVGPHERWNEDGHDSYSKTVTVRCNRAGRAEDLRSAISQKRMSLLCCTDHIQLKFIP